MHNTASDLDRTARRRAAAKLGWYTHALVYVLVNLLLAGLSAMSARPWAVYPALGWALGLFIHGLVVFVATGGGGLQERMLARERKRLGLPPQPRGPGA